MTRKRLWLSYQRATSWEVPPRVQVLRWARAAVLQGAWRVAVRFVDEEEAQALNAQYRHKDYPTNVLSFPYHPTPDGVGHGDLVLCAPVLHREASAQGKTLAAHCAHLVVHGMLHLQGFDHQTDEQAERMEALERQILQRLGFADPYEPTP